MHGCEDRMVSGGEVPLSQALHFLKCKRRKGERHFFFLQGQLFDFAKSEVKVAFLFPLDKVRI